MIRLAVRCTFRGVPARTNDFQELVTVLTEILGKDKTTPSAMLPDLAVPGASREVDICAEGEVAGHKVLVGIECRASKRPQTVEWVEAMHGKHSHLPTSKLVLVSSSGFSRNALKLAEFLKVKAIAPGEERRASSARSSTTSTPFGRSDSTSHRRR